MQNELPLNGGRSVNNLGRLKLRQLEDFVHARREKLEHGETFAECADEATRRLGYRVTADNVRGAAHVMGVRARVGGNRSKKGRDLAVIARELVGVMERLGDAVPPDLAELAEKGAARSAESTRS